MVNRLCLLLPAFFLFLSATLPLQANLDEYVNKSEPSYDWTLKETKDLQSSEGAYWLRMTSQTWQDITWKHDLMVLLPEDPPKKIPLILVAAGGDGEWNSLALEFASQFSNKLNAAIAVLFNIPNQPLFNDLSEDDLIAYTFDQYLKTGNPNWPLLFPMTKATVQALTTLNTFFAEELDRSISNTIVTGGSKRGWTSWLTGAVDDRVDGIIPIVIDVLNFPAQLRNQIQSWGDFSKKIHEYTRRNLHVKFLSDRGRKLIEMVDPYFHRDRIKIPKLIISGTNDRYWPLNSVNLFFEQLKGDSYQYYIKNVGHSLERKIYPLVETFQSFLRKIQGKLDYPEFDTAIQQKSSNTWQFSVETRTQHSLDRVEVWYATSKTKDFRNSKWKKKDLGFEQQNITNILEVPSGKYLGFIFQLHYTIKDYSFSLSSQSYRLKNQFLDSEKDRKQK